MNKNEVQIVLTTCPAERAGEIARVLVQEQLAACVNIVGGMQAVYRWHGQMEQTTECLLLIKGRSDQYERIQQRLLDLHPYELPEILAVPVTAGLPAYLAWLSTQG